MRQILKLCLQADNFLYKIISKLAILTYGYHPKHDIIDYRKWFSENCIKQGALVDIGCNTGQVSKYIKKNYPALEVIGIDVEEKYINIAKKIETGCKFYHADATKFDYSQINDLNTVVLSNVLEHIENRSEFLLSIMSQINRTDLTFLIRVPTHDRDWRVELKRMMNVDSRLDKTHFIEFTDDSFEKLMRECNLTILRYEKRWGEIFSVVK